MNKKVQIQPNDHKSPINMKVREQVVVEGCASEQQKKFIECINNNYLT